MPRIDLTMPIEFSAGGSRNPAYRGFIGRAKAQQQVVCAYDAPFPTTGMPGLGAVEESAMSCPDHPETLLGECDPIRARAWRQHTSNGGRRHG